jgi:hypothetical protein
MKKIFYWGIKIISVLLLIIPLVLCLPGFMLHVLAEELDNEEE